MSSKTLLIRSANRLINNSQQCKYISTSIVLKQDKTEKTGTEIAVDPLPLRKAPDVFFTAKEKFERDEKLKQLITVECEPNAVGIVSGVPEEHIKTRTVTIYKPAKNAMQSGTDNTHHWQISFDTRERWENPLMGWCSSGDPLQGLRVDFSSEQEAIEHCKNMGWKYIVEKPNEVNPRPRSYGENFSWNKRTRVSTK